MLKVQDSVYIYDLEFMAVLKFMLLAEIRYVNFILSLKQFFLLRFRVYCVAEH
jgi:hypothetical protein